MDAGREKRHWLADSLPTGGGQLLPPQLLTPHLWSSGPRWPVCVEAEKCARREVIYAIKHSMRPVDLRVSGPVSDQVRREMRFSVQQRSSCHQASVTGGKGGVRATLTREPEAAPILPRCLVCCSAPRSFLGSQ